MTAPPCSAALPTIATITAATKNSEQVRLVGEDLSVPTSISATSAVATVATPRTTSAKRERPAAAFGLVAGSRRARRCRRSEYHVATT